MILSQSTSSTSNKLILIAYLLCLVAFFLPATSITLGGQHFWQYLLTGYAGWAAFGVILLLAIVQAIVFFRKRKVLPVLGLAAGAYSAWYAIRLIYKSYALGNSSEKENLAGSLQFSAGPSFGLYLLAFAGGLLFVLSLSQRIAKTNGGLPTN
jgi:hypothetical protein